MEITNPPQFVPYLVTTDNDKIFCKIVEITSWNMDLSPSVGVTHGLGTNWAKIVGISAFVTNDAGDTTYDLLRFVDSIDPGLINGGIRSIDSTTILLNRRTGGYFDNVSFDDAFITRGYLLIWFKE